MLEEKPRYLYIPKVSIEEIRQSIGTISNNDFARENINTNNQWERSKSLHIELCKKNFSPLECEVLKKYGLSKVKKIGHLPTTGNKPSSEDALQRYTRLLNNIIMGTQNLTIAIDKLQCLKRHPVSITKLDNETIIGIIANPPKEMVDRANKIVWDVYYRHIIMDGEDI